MGYLAPHRPVLVRLRMQDAGDKAHKASVSSPLPLVVHQMASTVSVSAKRNPKNAREFRFSARVQTHVVGVHATGTMTFVVGGRGYTFALDSLGHAAFHLVLTAGRTYTVVATICSG